MQSPKLPTIAICAIVRDEADYIEEWVKFHQAQGVSKFYIYDNGSKDNTADILSSLGISCASVEKDHEDFGKTQTWSYYQSRIPLADFDWVAFIDIDEFLFGRNGKSLPEVLADFPADVSAIAVQQRLFGSSFLETHEPGNVVDRFTMCTEPDSAESLWFKSIVRPSKLWGLTSAHSVVISDGRYVLSDGSDYLRNPEKHAGVAPRVTHGLIGLHHYIVKSREEFLKKSARWADRPRGASKKVENYFDTRQQSANAVHCFDLVGMPKRDAK